MLESAEENALDFIDDFKLNLFAEEIFVFTPDGEMRTIPSGATALDFAFEIHTKIGEHCIGAKVNHKLVPLSYKLKGGDQVELLTSKKQTPTEDWLGFVITAKAKAKIKHVLKNERKAIADKGREDLEKKFYKQKLEFTVQNIQEFTNFLSLKSTQETFYRAAKDVIGIAEIKEFIKYKQQPEKYITKKLEKQNTVEEMVTQARGKSDMLVIGDDMQQLDYKLSPCCTPIPGDDVFGFVTVGKGIDIHRVNCPNAAKLLANYAYRVVRTKWNSDKLLTFLASVKITGTDAMGIVNNITKVISTQHNVNMRSISFDTDDGIFEGTIMVYVHSTEHLNQLSNNLKKVPGVINVQRIDGENKK